MCRVGAQRKWFSRFVVWFGVHDEALWHMREVRLENRSQIWNACTWFSHILRTQLARQNPKSGSFFFLYRSETFSSVWDDRRGQETTCVWTRIGATSRRRDFTATLAFLKVWDSLPSFLTPRDNTPPSSPTAALDISMHVLRFHSKTRPDEIGSLYKHVA